MKNLVPPQDADRRPNWSKWRKVRWVRIWEGVALSLDIDPDKVQLEPLMWMGGIRLFEESQEFDDRLAVACRNLTGEDEPEKMVNVPEFADWCVFENPEWHIPKELRALASKPTQASEAAKRHSEVPQSAAQRNVRPAFPEGQLADIQQAYDDIRADTGKEPSQRAVAKKSGYARETVRNCWPQLKRTNQPK